MIRPEDEATRKRMGECILLEGHEKSGTVKQRGFQGVNVDEDEESMRCESRWVGVW